MRASSSEEKLRQQLDGSDVSWFQDRLEKWGSEHLREFPWRDTSSAYEIFVAECLLQQTDAPRVEPVYRRFLRKFPDLQALAGSDPEEVRELVEPLGLHFRAERMRAAARALVSAEDGRGKIPSDKQELLELPGVGRYVAVSILANAFERPAAVLDTNVVRILKRFFGIDSNRARARRDPEFWDLAQSVAPDRNVARWNLTLLDFGAAVCTSRNPSCDECPLAERCHYKHQVRDT